jgi:ATP-binding cassette subfamily A (ABC1) protein 3
MTTHSMEEVDALASRVGIIASKMLAVGTPTSLKNRFATYEIHLPADAVGPFIEILRKNGFEDARPSEDTSTRISVPGVKEADLSRLLGVMQRGKAELGDVEMALQESVWLAGVYEVDADAAGRRLRLRFWRL